MRRSTIRHVVVLFFAGLAVAAHGDYERREAEPVALALGVVPPPVIVPNKVTNFDGEERLSERQLVQPGAGSVVKPQATIGINPRPAGGAAAAGVAPQVGPAVAPSPQRTFGINVGSARPAIATNAPAPNAAPTVGIQSSQNALPAQATPAPVPVASPAPAPAPAPAAAAPQLAPPPAPSVPAVAGQAPGLAREVIPVIKRQLSNGSNVGAKNNALANGVPQSPQPTVKVNPGNQGTPGTGQAAPLPQQAGSPMQGALPQGAQGVQAAQGIANGPAPGPAAPAVTIRPAGQQAAAGTATLAPQGQGNGNAGGVVGTVTITTGVNGGNVAAGATPNAANPNAGGLRTVSINVAGQGAGNNGQAGAANPGNGRPATVTIRPAGPGGNNANGAANNPNAGNIGNGQTITLRPGGAAASGAPAANGAPQGVAGAQGANACSCMCACPAGAFGGVAGMPGIMEPGAMNPPPAAAQPTTLTTSASIPAAAPAAAPPPAADPAAAQGQQAAAAAPPAAAALTSSVPALAAMAPGNQVTVSGGAIVPLQSAVTVPLLGRMFHIGPVEGAEAMWS